MKTYLRESQVTDTEHIFVAKPASARALRRTGNKWMRQAKGVCESELILLFLRRIPIDALVGHSVCVGGRCGGKMKRRRIYVSSQAGVR